MNQSDDKLEQWLEAHFGAADTRVPGADASSTPEFEEFEAAAAAYDLARMDDLADAMPDGLAERIRVAAELTDAADTRDASRVVSMPRAQATAGATGGTSTAATPRRRRNIAPWLAVAASLVIAVAGWWPQLAPQTSTTTDPAAARDAFIASADQLMRVPLSGTDDPAASNASGELVWDPETQRGFVTVRNLAKNQPTEAQYQLWIFDSQRDTHPVDAGVFNVDDADQTVIDFTAKLPVGKPKLFAITVEQPGGVVVSDQGRIAMVGQVES